MAKLGDRIGEDEVTKYCKNNGIVIRTILSCWGNKTFTWNDLAQTLAGYNMEKEDVIEALISFDQMQYIITKLKDNRQRVELIDFADELDDIYFALNKAGRDIAYGLTKDKAIEL